MTSPVISSRIMRSPNSFISTCASSSRPLSLEKSLSASDSSVFTAAVRALSAGPGASWIGRTRSGSIGFVELGTR